MKSNTLIEKLGVDEIKYFESKSLGWMKSNTLRHDLLLLIAGTIVEDILEINKSLR